MSVYREFYHGVSEIQKASKRVYPDACDFGALTKKGDRLWNTAKQLMDWYGKKETRKHHDYATGQTCEIVIEGMDEWAVSDERKTESEATDRFKMVFVGVKGRKIANAYDGYIYLEKL